MDTADVHRLRDARDTDALFDVVMNDENFLRVRVRAAQCLLECGDERSSDSRIVDFLIESLQDDVRAAEALGEIGDPRAVEPLIDLLQHSESESYRWRAATALGEIEDRRAVEPLSVALSDEDTEVRRSAVFALETMNGPQAYEALTAALQDKDLSIRRKTEEILAKMDLAARGATVEERIQLLRSHRNWKELAELGEPGAAAIIEALDRDQVGELETINAVDVLRSMKTIQALPLLADRLERVETRRNEVLGQLGPGNREAAVDADHFRSIERLLLHAIGTILDDHDLIEVVEQLDESRPPPSDLAIEGIRKARAAGQR